MWILLIMVFELLLMSTRNPKSFFDTSILDLDYRGRFNSSRKGSVEGNSGGNLENARGTNRTLEGGLKRGGQPPPSFLSRSRSFSASA